MGFTHILQITSGTLHLNDFGAFSLEIKLPDNVNLGETSLELNLMDEYEKKDEYKTKSTFTHHFQVEV